MAEVSLSDLIGNVRLDDLFNSKSRHGETTVSAISHPLEMFALLGIPLTNEEDESQN